MFNSSKELKEKLQVLLEKGHVDYLFVNDIKDLMFKADYTEVLGK